MKRKAVAMALAVVLTLSMSMTAFAASSTTGGNSSTGSSSTSSSDSTESSSSSTSSSGTTEAKPQSVDKVVANTVAGAEIKPNSVQVAIPSTDGTVKAVTLDTVVAQKQKEVVNTVTAIAEAAASGGQTASQIAEQVSTLLTSQVSEQFSATVEALAEIKGADMVVNNMGTIKTASTAKDVYGNTIASAGVVKNVTSGALIMLMSINADGTIEYVEGVVDPITGAVMGAFQGTPAVITVLVLA